MMPWHRTDSLGGMEGGDEWPRGIPREDVFLAQYASLRRIMSTASTMDGMSTIADATTTDATPLPLVDLDPATWRWFETLNWFRMAAITHGVYCRALAGNAGSSKALRAGYQFLGALRLAHSRRGAPPSRL